MDRITVTDIAKTFQLKPGQTVTVDGLRSNAITVLSGLDLSIRRGELITLVGPSGSGKSVLLDIVAGLTDATAGVARIDGEAISGLNPRMAYVFQHYALFLFLVPDHFLAWLRGEDGRSVDAPGFALCSLALLGLLGGLELGMNGAGRGLAATVLLGGPTLGVLGWRHMTRVRAPLFDLRVLDVPSFRLATMTAGTLGRIAINATPFLLPLLFQVGFGLSALASGRLVLVYFLGNILMKGATSPILRTWGFRTVVIGNGLLAAATVAGFAAVPAGMPELALWALLLATGAFRSLQLTALNTLAFADVSERQRATSTTLTAMTQQVAQLLGVALSVDAIRASEIWRGPESTGVPDLRAAFLGMAALGAVSALAFLRLAPDTGREVTGHRG